MSALSGVNAPARGPRHDYLNVAYGIRSWLLTLDHSASGCSTSAPSPSSFCWAAFSP